MQWYKQTYFVFQHKFLDVYKIPKVFFTESKFESLDLNSLFLYILILQIVDNNGFWEGYSSDLKETLGVAYSRIITTGLVALRDFKLIKLNWIKTPRKGEGGIKSYFKITVENLEHIVMCKN